MKQMQFSMLFYDVKWVPSAYHDFYDVYFADISV